MSIPAPLLPHFETLRAALAQVAYNDIDLFEMIGHFAYSSPPVAYAMALHTADILRDITDETNYTEVVIEVYRRTFFDADTAAKFGTDGILVLRPEEADSFVFNVVQATRMTDPIDPRLLSEPDDGEARACH